MRLGQYRWYTGILAFSTTAINVIVYLLMQVLFNVGRESGWPGAAIALPIALVILVTTALVIANVRAPQPWVNFDTSEIRLGRRVSPMAELSWATLEVLISRRGRTLVLKFGSKRLRSVFVVRNSRGKQISGETQRFVAEVLRRSSVAMPKDPFDPKGRFIRSWFPTNIEKDEAVELVVNPPGPEDPLPVVTAQAK